jgi:hypothetical protein
VALLAFWLSEGKYNFFHLPTSAEAVKLQGDYTAPPLYWFLEDATVVLCPGLLLGFFTMDMGTGANLVMWAIAVTINGVVYYWLGLVIRAIARRKA